MKETSKSHPSRVRNNDYERFLHGDILDIGSGDDPLTVPSGTVRPWDLPDGDAQYLKSLNDRSFDAVYSSHCLEHMVDVDESIKNWSRVLKDGGALYVVVPDYLLYERKNWPSRYNGDHKASFSLFDLAKPTDHPHYTYRDMVALGCKYGLTLVDARIGIDNYDLATSNNYSIDQTRHGALAQIVFVYQKL